MPKLKLLTLLSLLALTFPQLALADGKIDFTSGGYSNLEETVAHLSTYSVYLAGAILIILAIISLKIKKLNAATKKLLFISISGVAVLTTLFLAGATIYLNVVSSSGGPVHWHADIEIYQCGQEIELADPEGLSNRIGTPSLHEHNDKRMHLEGVVVTPKDASIGKFFDVIGGQINSQFMIVPTQSGVKTYKNGETCPSGQTAQLQMFAYKAKDGQYTQSKVDNIHDYIFSPYGQVPPGDCLIIEFDAPKSQTNHLCRSYQVAETIGKIKKGAY